MAKTPKYSGLAKPQIGQQPSVAEPQPQYSQMSQNLAPTSSPATTVAPNQSTASTGMQNRLDASKLAKNSVQVDNDGDQVLGDPKTYDSAGSYGSGFINMSSLLGLNKGSGGQSAKAFAGGIKSAGQSAMSGIDSLNNEFTGKAQAGMTGWGTDQASFDPGLSDAGKTADSRANAQYTGPNDFTQLSGYADLAKKVGAAQDAARASQTGYGVAGQVGKQTGLSPVQSAASSFYMGVNNPNIKRAGSAFTNLAKSLDDANNMAMSSSNFAKGAAQRAQAEGRNEQAAVRDYNDPRNDANNFANNNPKADKAANDAWEEVYGSGRDSATISSTERRKQLMDEMTNDHFGAKDKEDFIKWYKKKHPNG